MHITTSSYVAYFLLKQHALRKMRSLFGQWKQKGQVKEALLKAPLTQKWKWKIDQDIMHALYGKQNCMPGRLGYLKVYQRKGYHQISWSKRNSSYTDPFTAVGSWSIEVAAPGLLQVRLKDVSLICAGRFHYGRNLTCARIAHVMQQGHQGCTEENVSNTTIFNKCKSSIANTNSITNQRLVMVNISLNVNLI